ncbi:MAG: cytochrome c [Pseudomonadota bacterium]
MSYTTAGVLLTGLLTCTAVPAESFDRGQALYENHCQTCHESHVHLRARRASSLDELHKWVATWSWHANLGWSDEDITDVADYLNRHFLSSRCRGGTESRRQRQVGADSAVRDGRVAAASPCR